MTAMLNHAHPGLRRSLATCSVLDLPLVIGSVEIAE
jgi:hypothetical protein